MGQEKMNLAVAQAPDEITIGIDISKLRLDVHVHPHRLVRQFANDRKGHTQLISWIKPQQPARIIFEATGAYHRALEKALGKAGLAGVKINPLQPSLACSVARRFAEATGKRVKTDPVDAAMLARFGATLRPDIRPAPDETIDTLSELLVARRALVKDRTAALNRAKTLTLSILKRQNQRQLKQIEDHIAAIDREHASVLAANAELRTRFDILISIPGLGAATALALLIEMPELGDMSGKHAASLIGLAPVTRQSGNWRGKAFIQGGRGQIRQAIYMPALVAIRFNAPLKAKYMAMRAAGKPAKVAIVAIMRKLVVIANALLRDARMWSPERSLT
jgi:transposase